MTISVLVKCFQLLSYSQLLHILKCELLKIHIHILLCNRERTLIACNTKSKILRTLISLTGQSSEESFKENREAI